MNKSPAAYRVIGIKHTLRRLKKAGLVDEDSNYPDEAVYDIQNGAKITATKWYKVGAKRGGIEVLNAILRGELEVVKNKEGGVEIISHTNSIQWTKSLKIRLGHETIKTDSKQYKLTVKELEFI